MQESPTTTVIDGHWGFGYVVNDKAMALTIEKAKTANVAAGTVFRQSHIGRLAAYPLMAAGGHDRASPPPIPGARQRPWRRSAGARRGSAPTRSRSRCRPISTAPLYLDMATSAVAAGKIALAVARGEPMPDGWIIDKDGKPTTDPTPAAPGRRAPAARRHRGLQGHRPCR